MSQTKKKSGYGLTDPTTWFTILSIAWAVLAVVHPGFHLQAYIAPASVVAAALVTSIIGLAKHQIPLIGAVEEIVAAISQAFATKKEPAPAEPPAPAPAPAPAAKASGGGRKRTT